MKPKCYIQLGKHGDIIILLPGLRRIFDRTGVRPVLMVSNEFAETVEGVSYVRRWNVQYHWFQECHLARQHAEREFGRENVIFPKWWDDELLTPRDVKGKATDLIEHAVKMGIEKPTEPHSFKFSYMSSQWKHAGFPLGEIMEQPIFDRRVQAREQALINKIFTTKKPKLLYCLNGSGSSPFIHKQEVMPIIWAYRDTHEIIDLSEVWSSHIFDLLGLIEQAQFVITSDTSILHLTGATNTPYLAFISNMGGGSIPRGNCVGRCRYGHVTARLNDIKKHVEYQIHSRYGMVPREANARVGKIQAGHAMA